MFCLMCKSQVITLAVQDCREENGVHTCDKRNSRSYIASYKPHFLIEEGFTELDELWDPNLRETKEEVSLRARTIIDRVFENDTDSYCQYFPLSLSLLCLASLRRYFNYLPQWIHYWVFASYWAWTVSPSNWRYSPFRNMSVASALMTSSILHLGVIPVLVKRTQISPSWWASFRWMRWRWTHRTTQHFPYTHTVL